jgi:hypothetical protein
MDANIDALELALATKQFPPMSPWWDSTLKRFYASGKRQLVLRCGRRAGKSTMLCRVGVLEALYGEHVIPPGDVGTVAILSVDKEEARGRIRTIRSILDALGVRYTSKGDSIELATKPIKFRVLTASVGGVVGGTIICAICDEVSRWKDADTGANPASEVLTSLRPAMATMPNAKIFLSSSPLGTLDAHAKAFDAGEDDVQCVAHATSFEANPTLSEAEARKLEPNLRAYRREYEAIPQGPVAACFDPVSIDSAEELYYRLRAEVSGHRVMCIDPSRGRDAWTFAVVGWEWSSGLMRLRVYEIGEVPDASDAGAAVTFLVAKARAHGTTVAYTDQYEFGPLRAMFSEQGISLLEQTWSAASKRRAVDHFDRLLTDTRVLFPKVEKLHRQAIEYSEKISRGGELTYAGAGRHDDYISCLLTGCMADLDGKVEHVEAPAAPSAALSQAEANRRFEEKWTSARVRAHEQELAYRKDMGLDWSFESFEDQINYLPY